jgi:hypothetical protein
MTSEGPFVSPLLLLSAHKEELLLFVDDNEEKYP